jgi:hypothetical protein
MPLQRFSHEETQFELRGGWRKIAITLIDRKIVRKLSFYQQGRCKVEGT